jgi:hypothetical protein
VVNGQDGLGAPSYGSFDMRRIDVEGARIDVDKNRGSALIEDHVGGGDEAVEGGDDFIAEPESEEYSSQGEEVIGEDQVPVAEHGRRTLERLSLKGGKRIMVAVTRRDYTLCWRRLDRRLERETKLPRRR